MRSVQGLGVQGLGVQGLAIALVGAFLLAVIGTTPPGPLPADAPGERFSADRAMQDIERIAAVPHVTGSPANAAVRAYLVDRLRALGLDVVTDGFPIPQRVTERLESWGAPGAAEGVNVIGVLPGRDRDLPALMLMAHYDSVWGSPGAADDAAGVASILEVLRAMDGEGSPRRDIVVLFTDAEEIGLVGARAFFADHPLKDRIGAIVNLEARGGGGRTTLFQTSRDNGEAVDLYARTVGRPG
ncbi:MAG: M20/M25/M40 family metallo-hydrolase, partial [Pseudomonadota bacterium]